MTADLAKYVLPARFIQAPTGRSNRTRMRRAWPVTSSIRTPPGSSSAWPPSIRSCPRPSGPCLLPDAAPFRVVSGRPTVAVGHVICQVPFAAGEDLEFPLVRPLTYRARLRISTLQGLLDDLRQAGQLATGGETAAFIQRRIEELKV